MNLSHRYKTSPFQSKLLLLLFMGMYLFCTPLCAQKEDLKFHSIGMNSSRNFFNSTFKDSKGFIWFCSEYGLYMYDGYDYIVYKNNRNDTNSLSINLTKCIVEDKDGMLWIGTNVLNRFDRKKNIFTRYPPILNENKINFSKSVNTLFIDSDQHLWIGMDGGLAMYDNANNTFNKFLNNSDNKSIKNDFIINCIIEKNSNQLWIGTNAGLFEFDKKTGSYKCYTNNPSNSMSIAENNIKSLYFDKSNNTLWIGHETNFLSKLDLATGLFYNFKKSIPFKNVKIVRSIIPDQKNKLWLLSNTLIVFDTKSNESYNYENDPDNPTSFPAHDIRGIYKDNTGIFWIASDDIFICNPQKDKFSKYLKLLPHENKNVIQNYTKTFYYDKKDNLWIGTFEDGLLKINTKTQTQKRFFQNMSTPITLTTNCILHINPDSTGNFWISTGGGLLYFDPINEKIIKKYIHDPKNNNSIYHNRVARTLLDHQGTLWIITQESIERLNLASGKIIHHLKDNLNGMSDYKSTILMEDKRGDVWIGTFRGLNRYSYKTKTFSHYKFKIDQKGSISNSYINYIFEAQDGTIWVTTQDGLNRYDSKTDSFTGYFKEDGFLFNNIQAIQEDNHSSIWITTTSGIINFNPKTGKLKSYDNNDGIAANTDVIYKDYKGTFYIGGRYGNMYSFHPDSIYENRTIPPVYITDFLLFNKTIIDSENKKESKIVTDLFTNNSITLTSYQSVFTFVFSALNYTNPEKNLYRYKMEGFDKDWVNTDAKRRFTTYTNLDYGKYIFKVQASNNDGHWNENGVSINVTILPPFWRTWIAYVIYFIIIVILLTVFVQLSLRRENERNRIANEQRVAEKMHEMDQMKLRFFSNISHEFRTPLTLIIGPTEKLIKTIANKLSTENIISQLKLIYRNSLRLERLITEIMDSFKLDSGEMNINPVEDDIVQYTKDIAILFQHLADQKQIQLTVNTNPESIRLWFDPTMMEKIIFNLLSNAFKFTAKGNISINITIINNKNIFDSLKNNLTDKQFVCISIKDDGCGIPDSDLNLIFNRFYQAKNQTINKQGGTGLGLALTKELIEMHNGKINVQSKLNEGTCFTLYFPLGNTHFTDEQLNQKNENKNMFQHDDKLVSILEPIETPISNNPIETENESTAPILLIVEDNIDLRMYLKNILEDKYRIEVAMHGKEGFEKALDLMPDLIISDVMMPVMDGIEMTRKIKLNSQTSHIPVILLTARDTNENRIEGLETGAFDYITKPFNEDILFLKIKNIRENQESLRIYYQGKIQDVNEEKYIIPTKDINISTFDNAFIERLKIIIENNIANSDFSIEMLASELGMVSRTLNRKLNSLLKQPAGDVILEIRLRKAQQLLFQSGLTISDISFQCGFSNASYFSTCFKKHFGIPPSDART